MRRQYYTGILLFVFAAFMILARPFFAGQVNASKPPTHHRNVAAIQQVLKKNDAHDDGFGAAELQSASEKQQAILPTGITVGQFNTKVGGHCPLNPVNNFYIAGLPINRYFRLLSRLRI